MGMKVLVTCAIHTYRFAQFEVAFNCCDDCVSIRKVTFWIGGESKAL